MHSYVVLYADTMTDSIKTALGETGRRRTLQLAYNEEHHIVPETIRKPIREKEIDLKDVKHLPRREIPNLLIALDAEMKQAAEVLDFERAIAIRERIKQLNARAAEDGDT